MEDTSQDKPSVNGKSSPFRWLCRLLPQKANSEDTLREALEDLISAEDEESGEVSDVASHERQLISNILDLRDLTVVDIMVPRADIVAVDIAAAREDIIHTLVEKPHSRLPIYKGDLDNIIGVIHIKDMVAGLANNQDFQINTIMREAVVVSPAMRVMDLMVQLRQSKMHIAFVVDEFGGIDGLITINDMIEAIVGKIDDEHSLEIEPQFIERPDGSAVADARYPVEVFEKKYGNIFTEDEENEDADTLGGLITAIAGHVPARGEIVRHSSGIEFVILEADPRRVVRVRVRNLPQKETPPPTE